jgi:glycosyltransferase involved in cell wall biosynthesis
VRFLGFVEDEEQRALLCACDLFAWPSRYEGFGLPPLEAMQCGAPVVSSNASSMPEVVGEASLLVSPNDITGMAEALVAVAGDDTLQARLRAAGLEQAKQFTWERTAELTAASYRRAVRRDPW